MGFLFHCYYLKIYNQKGRILFFNSMHFIQIDCLCDFNMIFRRKVNREKE